MNEHLPYDSFCILYRTNAQSRAFEDALRKKNIPYRINGSTSFYQRKEIKDVISYLRLVINPADEEALKRIINFPARGIGQTTIDKLIVTDTIPTKLQHKKIEIVPLSSEIASYISSFKENSELSI